MLHYLRELFYALDFASMSAAVLRVAAIILCMTVHETCHGLAAYALGDPTAKSMHRLSLNPLRHIDWLGLALMFVAGFGWAKPVPVDLRYFKKPKQGMALTALAGPVSNFVLAFLALLACKAILCALQRRLGPCLFLLLLHRHFIYRPGGIQPDPHPAAGWLQGVGSAAAGPVLWHLDAL